MIKTRGKKNPTPFIALFMIILAAAVLLLIRPDLRFGRKQLHRGITETGRDSTPESPVEKRADSSPSRPQEKLKIAVIIDDVGYNSAQLEKYRDFEGKLTFSILPFLENSSSSANLLHEEGFEIMIHVPMEPIDYPDRNPGRDALLLEDSKNEVEQKLSRMIRANPHATGANNHMGSRATQNEQLMTWTLSYLQRKGFFFVDSVTTGDSLAYGVSRRMKMPSARRDIFLDNHDDFSYINGQFELLKVAARENGTAIGIGHIQQQNLLVVLNRQIRNLDKEGFELVFASEVLTN
jgi:polysaccharide deacetylase 2 family uncharacterized protein YibQ